MTGMLELNQLVARAKAGDDEAQFELGQRYAEGKGVPQDLARAVEWYRKAAEAGHTAAQVRLAECYLTGRGVPKDLKQAVFWQEKAIEGGYTVKQHLGALSRRRSRLSSGIRDIPAELAERTLRLAERLTDLTESAQARFQRSLLGRLWLKARWALMGLLWLGGLGLGYAGLARVSTEQGQGWSPGDLALRTLQLFVLDSGALRSGLVSDQTVLMLECARVLLIVALLFTGFLVVPRLFDRL